MYSDNKKMFEKVDLGSEGNSSTSDEKGKSKSNNKRRLPISMSISSSPLTKRMQPPLETNIDQSYRENNPDQLTVEQHRALVHAIYEIGLSDSSPMLIWEHMSEKIKAAYPELNIEKLKSKLQKYRKNKDKYEEEFMSEYDTTLKELLEQDTSKSGGESHPLSSGGPDIANLTHSILIQEDAADTTNSMGHTFPFLSEEKARNVLHGDSSRPSASLPISDNQGSCGAMTLPVLTQAEMNSPIGKSFDFFFALFESLKCELYAQREKQRWSAQNGNHHFSLHDNINQVEQDAHPDTMSSLNPRGHEIHQRGSFTPIPSSEYVYTTNDQKQQPAPAHDYSYENGDTEKAAMDIDTSKIKYQSK